MKLPFIPLATVTAFTERCRVYALMRRLNSPREFWVMMSTTTRRPRNVDAKRAAAILYGDWGTSKAYVIGLAFAVAGYSSFWLIAAMCVLTALVGINYIVICRLYPDGGVHGADLIVCQGHELAYS